jgi:hypothetical protein
VVDRIEERVRQLFDVAGARGLTPEAAALDLARERLDAAGPRPTTATAIVEH